MPPLEALGLLDAPTNRLLGLGGGATGSLFVSTIGSGMITMRVFGIMGSKFVRCEQLQQKSRYIELIEKFPEFQKVEVFRRNRPASTDPYRRRITPLIRRNGERHALDDVSNYLAMLQMERRT